MGDFGEILQKGNFYSANSLCFPVNYWLAMKYLGKFWPSNLTFYSLSDNIFSWESIGFLHRMLIYPILLEVSSQKNSVLDSGSPATDFYPQLPLKVQFHAWNWIIAIGHRVRSQTRKRG